MEKRFSNAIQNSSTIHTKVTKITTKENLCLQVEDN